MVFCTKWISTVAQASSGNKYTYSRATPWRLSTHRAFTYCSAHHLLNAGLSISHFFLPCDFTYFSSGRNWANFTEQFWHRSNFLSCIVPILYWYTYICTWSILGCAYIHTAVRFWYYILLFRVLNWPHFVLHCTSFCPRCKWRYFRQILASIRAVPLFVQGASWDTFGTPRPCTAYVAASAGSAAPSFSYSRARAKQSTRKKSHTRKALARLVDLVLKPESGTPVGKHDLNRARQTN